MVSSVTVIPALVSLGFWVVVRVGGSGCSELWFCFVGFRGVSSHVRVRDAFL